MPSTPNNLAQHEMDKDEKDARFLIQLLWNCTSHKNGFFQVFFSLLVEILHSLWVQNPLISDANDSESIILHEKH